MIDQHAILAPSGAFAWVECSEYVRSVAKYPELEETEDAKQGTASHWVGSEVLDSYKPHAPSVLTAAGMVGKTAPNGVVIDDAMAEGAELYIDDVLRIVQEFGLLSFLQVEQRVHIPRVHIDNWGTPDVWVYDENTKTIFMWDYKYGYRFVDVFENWQLIDYMIGIVDELTGDDTGRADQSINVVMRIVQPRSYTNDGSIREWRLKASDLRGYANILKTAADKAINGPFTFTTGTHCRDCRVRHDCPAATSATNNAMDVAGMAAPLMDMTPADRGVYLTMLKRAAAIIDAQITGQEVELEMLVRGGSIIPGWEMQSKQGRKNWNKPVAEIIMMGKMFGHDLSKDGAITPTQAIEKGIDANIINGYSSIPTTGVRLVQDDGSRTRHLFTQRKKQS